MKTFFGVIMILSAASQVAAGQSRWEVAPAIGMYFPTGSSQPVANGLTRQVAAGAVSVQIGYWPVAKVGLEASVAFSPSFIAHETVGKIRDIHAAVTTVGARAVWRLSTVRVGAGAGLVNGAWTPQIAAALRVPLTPTLSADFQMQDYIRHPRHDLIWALAFVIPLSR
jgi:hypothetical protein